MRQLPQLLLLVISVLQWTTVISWNPSEALLAALVDTSQLEAGMPQQVHIAVTKKNTEMSATWVTFEDVPQQLEFRKVFTTKTKYVQAATTKFVNPTGWVRYIHRAVMTDLSPGESYAYQVGRPGYLSKEFVFKQLPLQPPYNILVFGDLGVYNGESIPALLQEAAKKSFDLIVNVGDMAYDLFSNNGQTGDQYFATLEPLFATVPYMVVAGNHEAEENFNANYTTYRNSFTMPDEGFGDNQFYSFDVGPIHFLGLSSEYYGFYYLYGMEPVFNQYDWLVKDLEAANKNRATRPWIVSFFHRPFYCSNENSEECNAFENRLVRDGWLQMPGLEPLFIEQGVDIAFWGHEHSYERFYPRTPTPTYKEVADPYKNPAGPIYVISGSAGCHSGYAYFGDPVPFSAARVNDYGYSRMYVPNATHIHFEQYSVEKNAVVDEMWITKDKQTKFEKKTKEAEVIVCHPKDMHCHKQKESEQYDIEH
ncbi:hypothetical protein PENTCL1PPCAC_4231 [Pristionchus entomophagus]|uniref:Purple acid phosphatase n=1 Tax=Pristionchus entomophagus TaxID=358040 RepID=A0AAV5SR71_9BILA|nr:hypothetical protein PENTCL1PPCAC_4231 [Pristionchus entomophagus]